LVEVVNNFANNYISISNFNSAVGDLSELLANGTTLVDRIDEIGQRLRWQEIKE
jgi:hypothetical protein